MVRFSLRIPKDLYSRLRERAHREDRSVNNLIVRILRDATDNTWYADNETDDARP